MKENENNNFHNKNKISKRECEVLQLASEGLSIKESADRLGISIDTVETHRRNIFKKVGSKNITEAASMGLREGLIK